jgi:hypothetical protein
VVLVVEEVVPVLVAANAFFFFISHWWCLWWRRLYLFWWHGKSKIESNTTGYRLVKTKHKTEGGSTHSLKHLTYTAGGNQWPCDNQKSVGECKVKSVLLMRRCSLEGKIWWLDKCNFIRENQVEQVFTSRASLLGEPMFKVENDDTKKDMQKENETKAERKTQRSTSGKLFNRAHCGAEALVEIQVFEFFILFLNYYFF